VRGQNEPGGGEVPDGLGAYFAKHQSGKCQQGEQRPLTGFLGIFSIPARDREPATCVAA
jgi:hypothetical protein